MSKEVEKVAVGTTAGTVLAAPAAEAAAPAAVADKYVISANSIDDLAVRFAEIVLKTGGLFKTPEITADSKAKGKYSIWDLDDGMSPGPFSTGLGLTPEQAKRLSTKDGSPHVLSVRLMLRQFSPFSAIAGKLAERQAATATRDANRVSRTSENALLDELNKRRIARGEDPIEG